MNKILAITLFLSILATGCKSGQKESPKEDIKACSITDARQFYKDNTDKIEELCQEWEPNADLELALYTFIDIDNDGLEEMYIKESNEGYGWLLCCGSDSVEMITSEDRNFRMTSLVRLCDINRSMLGAMLYVPVFALVKSLKYRSMLPWKHLKELVGLSWEIRRTRAETLGKAAFLNDK